MAKITKLELTPKEELFCHIFATDRDCFGNGARAYLKTYGNEVKYMTAKTQAYRLLTKPHLVARIRELIDIYISDEVVDKELGEVILQYGDLSSKVAAIREYNRVKGRLAPTTIKFADAYGEWAEEQIKEEIARRRQLRGSGEEPDNKGETKPA